jgi:hypothetical protein
MADLLLYSMAEFLPLIRDLLPDRPISAIEIGSEAGYMTQELCRLVDRGAIERLTIIEPNPRELLASLGDRAGVVVEATTSREALPRLDVADLYLIDGDHNYYSVSYEIAAILERSEAEKSPTLLCCHDVTWPFDRRDLYYAPDRIPAEHRLPCSFERGVTLETDELITGGFRSCGAYAIAERRGGPMNGVLTAIEDALEKQPRWQLFVVPAVFGLGILLPRWHPEYARIAQRLAPYIHNFLIEKLERNRLALYLKVLALQDDLDALRAQRAGT